MTRHSALMIPLALILLFGCKATQELSSENRNSDETLDEQTFREFQIAFMDGNKEKILGNYPEAEALFNKALQLDPNSAATMFELAKLAFEDGRPGAAIDLARRAREADPDNPWYSEFLAQLYAETGQLEESTKIIREILDEHPEKYEYYFNLASILSARGEYGEALKIYDDLEDRFGMVEEISLQRQMIYLDQGKTEKALEEVNALIEMNPEEVRYLGMKAEILTELGRKEEAVRLYKDILIMDPDNGLVLISLYEMAEREGNHDEAASYLSSAFRSADLGIDVKVNILLNLLSQANPDQELLIRLSEELVETHGDNAKAHAIQGDIFNNFGRPEAARESFRKAVAIDPNRPPIWQEILILDSSLNDFEDMRTESEKALEYFPQQPVFYLFQGIALIQLNKHNEAIDMLTSGKNLVIENDELMGQFYSSLGDAHHALKNHEKSDAAYEKALKYTPANVVVLNNYAYYLSLRGVKLEQAEEMAKKANDLSPNQASFQDTYAWVLYRRGNYQNALFWIKEALENGGEADAEVLEHYGDILIALGKSEEAVDAWQKALDAGGPEDDLRKKIEKHAQSDDAE